MRRVRVLRNGCNLDKAKGEKRAAISATWRAAATLLQKLLRPPSHHDNVINTNSPPRRCLLLPMRVRCTRSFRAAADAGSFIPVTPRIPRIALAAGSSAPHHCRYTCILVHASPSYGSRIGLALSESLGKPSEGRQPHIPASRSSAAILYG